MTRSRKVQKALTGRTFHLFSYIKVQYCKGNDMACEAECDPVELGTKSTSISPDNV
jgi:hypothetical protein